MQINSDISQAVKGADKIWMFKNIFGRDRIETTLTAEKTRSFKRNTTDVWPSYGYFKQQPCDFGTDKKNMPKMLVFYINQSYQSFKDEKKVYYADYFILGQVDQCLNPPENLKEYQLKENEAIINHPRYDPVTGQCSRLYETLGYLMVRGDSDEYFLEYVYSKQNSKILHSYHRKRMPNSFSGTFFNRHHIQYKSGALNTDFSKIYLFLSSVTDRVEGVNRQMDSVNLSSIDITEENF